MLRKRAYGVVPNDVTLGVDSCGPRVSVRFTSSRLYWKSARSALPSSEKLVAMAKWKSPVASRLVGTPYTVVLPAVISADPKMKPPLLPLASLKNASIWVISPAPPPASV